MTPSKLDLERAREILDKYPEIRTAHVGLDGALEVKIAAALAAVREESAMSDSEWMEHCEAATNQARAEGREAGLEEAINAAEHGCGCFDLPKQLRDPWPHDGMNADDVAAHYIEMIVARLRALKSAPKGEREGE
jgi:hypothetical protein